MKKVFRNSLLFLTGLLMVTSCSKETTLIQPELELARYEQLSIVLENDFNQVASRLRDINSNFSDKESVIKVAEIHYGKESDGFSAFLNSFNNVSSSNGRISNDLTTFQQQSVEGLISALSGYSSLSEFQLFLDERFDDFSNQTLEANDKDFILTYIVSYKASLDFIADNQDLFISESTVNGRVQGWWSDWGKCAASIIGGTGAGALAGGEFGLKVGTLLANPIKGAIIGGIIGGVAGGIGAASVGC